MGLEEQVECSFAKSRSGRAVQNVGCMYKLQFKSLYINLHQMQIIGNHQQQPILPFFPNDTGKRGYHS